MSENPRPYSEAAGLTDAQAIADYVAQERARLREAFLASPSGRAHSLELTALFDAVLRRLFDLASAEARTVVQSAGLPMAILATGGYGRCDLCPRSDIDIAFVAAEEEDSYLDAVVRRMFFLIMDVFTVRADLKVGYAFRVPDECPDLDLQTRTALLDGRRIVGSEDLVARFEAELLRTMQPAAFLYGIRAGRDGVRSRAGAVVHRSEPDLKEGAGGLRDLHLAGWMARAQSSEPLADPLDYLVHAGALEGREAAALREAHEGLLRLRHAIHYAADRPVDTLTRGRQEEVAALLGIDDPRAVMEEYFVHAEVVHAACEKVAEKARAVALPLSPGLVVVNGEIAPADGERTWADLGGVIAPFRQSQVYGLPLQGELGRRLGRGAARLEREAAPGPGGRALLDVLRGESGIATALRQMARWGVLQHVIPEFGESMRTVPPAPVHEFTVGEHVLQVLGLLDELRHAGTRENDEPARVFGEIHRTDALFLAALLHDIGKRTDPANHCEAGAVEARAIAARLGMDAEGVELVEFLVRQHILMSDTARLRDLSQEQTIRTFIAVVDDVDRLNALFVLTWADLRMTGGGVWSPVQERFLEELYFRALRALAAPEKEEDLVTRVQRQRRRMQRELTLKNLPPDAVQAHCNAMPPGYLLNTPVDTIAAHIRLVQRLLAEGPVVEFVDPQDRDYTTVTLCTYDDPQPGLLSKIAAAFYAHNIDVFGAQVHTRDGEPGIALDTLWAASDGRRLRPFQHAELEKDLRDVMAGRVTAEALLRRQGKLPQTDLSGADAHMHNDLSESHTVIEIRIPDRRGLLYCLTHRLSELGWDIHSARINTIGGEAKDAFYVTDSQGRKLEGDPDAILGRLLGTGD